MSSSGGRSRRAVSLLLLALLAVCALPAIVALLACGKKGNPLPPVRQVPAPVKDLAVQQRGPRLLLGFTYPKLTPAGTALEGVSAVEVLEVVRPVPAGGVPRTLEPRELQAAGKRVLRLEGADVGAATAGDRIVLDLPLPSPLPATPEAHYLAVRAAGPRGDVSEPSNLVVIVPQPPPAPPGPPETVELDPQAGGIQVAWKEPEGASSLAGFNVYRRSSREKSFGAPLQAVGPEARSALDATARFGESYIYAVTSVAQRQPLIESAVASEREVRYVDRFPPPAPREPVALVEGRRVRVVWRSSDAPDLAGYLVYRSDEGGPFARLTERPQTELEFADQSVTPGAHLYRVTAVDQSGNESPPAEVAATVSPVG
jgi:hypothetical protein